MKAAIVGLGNIGSQVAANLMAGRQEIIVVDKGDGRANALAKTSDGKAQAATLSAAIAEADIVILAIYFDTIKKLVAENQEKLAGKIVVDPSNPIAPDGKGGFKKLIPQDQSAGKILAGLLPRTAKLVKAFGTVAAASLKSGANRSPERVALFYASDDGAAGNAVAKLIAVSGFDALGGAYWRAAGATAIAVAFACWRIFRVRQVRRRMLEETFS